MELDLIAFDADDTLWENEIYYQEGRRVFDRIMDRYQVPPNERDRLDTLEVENLQHYGYGAVGFAISMVEVGIQLTDGKMTSEEAGELLAVAKTIITTDVELMPEAERVVSTLSNDYPLTLITKGALVHQQQKVERSGLAGYFQAVEIVAEKDQRTYQGIFDRIGVNPSAVLMVGNSIRSDIRPVLELGGSAVHLTSHPSWDFEDEDVSDLPSERFFQVEELSGVLDLVQRLK